MVLEVLYIGVQYPWTPERAVGCLRTGVTGSWKASWVLRIELQTSARDLLSHLSSLLKYKFYRTLSQHKFFGVVCFLSEIFLSYLRKIPNYKL